MSKSHDDEVYEKGVKAGLEGDMFDDWSIDGSDLVPGGGREWDIYKKGYDFGFKHRHDPKYSTKQENMSDESTKHSDKLLGNESRESANAFGSALGELHARYVSWAFHTSFLTIPAAIFRALAWAFLPSVRRSESTAEANKGLSILLGILTFISCIFLILCIITAILLFTATPDDKSHPESEILKIKIFVAIGMGIIPALFLIITAIVTRRYRNIERSKKALVVVCCYLAIVIFYSIVLAILIFSGQYLELLNVSAT